MKRLLSLSTTLLLGSMSATAAGLSAADLAACAADVKELYGKTAEVKVVSSRPFMDGSRILMAAHVGPDEKGVTRTYLATCWEPVDDLIVFDNRDSDHIASRDAEVKIGE